jgi:hypothetical protein
VRSSCGHIERLNPNLPTALNVSKANKEDAEQAATSNGESAFRFDSGAGCAVDELDVVLFISKVI